MRPEEEGGPAFRVADKGDIHARSARRAPQGSRVGRGKSIACAQSQFAAENWVCLGLFFTLRVASKGAIGFVSPNFLFEKTRRGCEKR